MINEHDITKNMLSTIRSNGNNLNENRRLNEEDSDSIQLEGSERDDEVQKIKTAVAPRVKVDDETPIVYPYDDNVVLRGEFEGLKFELSTAQGLFITSESLRINDNDIVETIKKLDGYFDVWRDEWADKINEYKKDIK